MNSITELQRHRATFSIIIFLMFFVSSVTALKAQICNNTYPTTGNVSVHTAITPKPITIGGNLNCPDVAIQLRYDLEIPYYSIIALCTPGIPSVQDIKGNGLNLADMDSKLLQKIEELKLYVIQLNKDNEELRRKIQILKSRGE